MSIRVYTRRAGALCASLVFLACGSTYGPGDLEEDESITAGEECAENPDLPGCNAVDAPCMEAHDYLCDPL